MGNYQEAKLSVISSEKHEYHLKHIHVDYTNRFQESMKLEQTAAQRPAFTV